MLWVLEVERLELASHSFFNNKLNRYLWVNVPQVETLRYKLLQTPELFIETDADFMNSVAVSKCDIMETVCS